MNIYIASNWDLGVDDNMSISAYSSSLMNDDLSYDNFHSALTIGSQKEEVKNNTLPAAWCLYWKTHDIELERLLMDTKENVGN